LTDTNDYREQADACQSVTTLRRLVHELAADLDEHAALDAETDAGISQIELERDEAVRRADALERERDKLRSTLVPIRAIAAHAKVVAEDDDTNTRHLIVIHDSADAALTDQPNRERAAQIADDIGDAETAAEVRGRNDQPAQDGGRGATPKNVNDYLDGHDNGLNVGCRQGWNDALERAAKLAREWGEFGLASAIRRERRNLQPDQPADAGEPSCCARTPGDTL
jgi:hypothetical protein